ATTYGNGTADATAFTIGVVTGGASTSRPSAAVTLSGTPTEGEVFAIKLTDGSTVTTADYTANGTDTLANVLTQLSGQLSAYGAVVMGSTIVATNATAITLADAAAISANQAGHGITLTGSVAAGQVWSLDLTDAGVHGVAYASAAGDSLSFIAGQL